MIQLRRLTNVASVPVLAAGAAMALCAIATSAQATNFNVVNLVSDGSVPAANTDSQLVNPWGLATSAASPFWTANNANGLATLYNSAGTKQGLVVTIPPAGAAASADPTGVVFNGGSGFTVQSGGKSAAALFMFATESGTISGWAPSVNLTNAVPAVDNSASGAVYTGLTIGNNGVQDLLYAANFNSGQVEMYNSSFGLVGTLQDPTIAAGFAAYNVQTLAGHLFVTYAEQDAAKHDAISGAGLGYVDEFSLSGAFERRIASVGGQINNPWGLAIAPGAFGAFAGDLLVGNAGDGTISAYDPTTAKFVGQLTGVDGNPIVEVGLRALRVGNGGSGGLAQDIYFTAGGPTGGLLGSLSAAAPAAAVPEPASWALMLLGFGGLGAVMRSRRRLATA